jgi:hypothetical protein
MRNFRECFFPVSRETPHGPGPIGRRHRESIIRFEGIMWKIPRPSWDGRGASRDIKKTWPESLFPLLRLGPGSQAGTLARTRSGLNPITLDYKYR